MSNEDWIVLRFSRSLPMDEVPRELEGKWIDRSLVSGTFEATREVEALPTNKTLRTRHTVARPTGRFETDAELNVAEVYEVGSWDVAS